MKEGKATQITKRGTQMRRRPIDIREEMKLKCTSRRGENFFLFSSLSLSGLGNEFQDDQLYDGRFI